MTKTDDQIAADKEAVAKLRGAQGAMERAIKRIEHLEDRLEWCARVAEEAEKQVGDLVISTRYGDRDGSEYMRLAEAMRRLSNKARKA